MDINEAVTTIETTNPDVAKVFTEYIKNFNTTLDRVKTLELDLSKSTTKRDALKTIIRNSTGLSEITEEGLKNILNTQSNNTDVYKNEITQLQGKLLESTNAVNEVKRGYESELFTLRFEQLATKLGVSSQVQSPHAYSMVLEELRKGATFDETGNVGYKNPDGTTQYSSGGVPTTLATKYDDLRGNSNYGYMFKDPYKSGGGKTPHSTTPKGGTVGNLLGTKAEQEAYIKAKFNL